MNGKDLKKYRKNVGLSQPKLSEKSYIAQNTISQYEKEKRQMDKVTEEHLAYHLRVTKRTERFQLTDALVRDIAKQILRDEVLDAWTSQALAEPKEANDNVLLDGGKIILTCVTNNAIGVLGGSEGVLTLENLHIGFRQWVNRGYDYMLEQTVRDEEGEIVRIDDIGVNDIVQYALFNDVLCDLPH